MTRSQLLHFTSLSFAIGFSLFNATHPTYAQDIPQNIFHTKQSREREPSVLPAFPKWPDQPKKSFSSLRFTTNPPSKLLLLVPGIFQIPEFEEKALCRSLQDWGTKGSLSKGSKNPCDHLKRGLRGLRITAIFWRWNIMDGSCSCIRTAPSLTMPYKRCWELLGGWKPLHKNVEPRRQCQKERDTSRNQEHQKPETHWKATLRKKMRGQGPSSDPKRLTASWQESRPPKPTPTSQGVCKKSLGSEPKTLPETHANEPKALLEILASEPEPCWKPTPASQRPCWKFSPASRSPAGNPRQRAEGPAGNSRQRAGALLETHASEPNALLEILASEPEPCWKPTPASRRPCWKFSPASRSPAGNPRQRAEGPAGNSRQRAGALLETHASEPEPVQEVLGQRRSRNPRNGPQGREENLSAKSKHPGKPKKHQCIKRNKVGKSGVQSSH